MKQEGAEIKVKQYGASDTKIVQYLNILRSDTPFKFAYISAPDYRTEKFLYPRRSYESHLSNELRFSFLAYLLPEKLKKCQV